MDVIAATTGTPFSHLLRTTTHDKHDEANASPFIGHLLAGRLGIAAYARYTEQLWFVYRALEEAGEALRDDPVAGPFVRDELLRTVELERDLTFLLGDGWRSGVTPLPATAAYVARVEECARTWPAGFVAHHYTRYLGDLSGGQVIRDQAEKTWGFSRKGDGVRFYVFEEISNPAAFKRMYRELLDTVNADDLEKQRIVEECRRAFDFNSAVFWELNEAYPLSA
ncbi:biliverdin-producing heme oxygenase [Streptomyces sp. NPDC006798]|uniref:biliverdin-producing heme oxygenase n=1 Tax=Streptomyces sp. NPDC006798 TaxID=3155462 RepID=UPI0033F0585D